MFDDNAVHDIGYVVEAVDDFFEMIVDLIADEKRHRIRFGFRQIELPKADIVQFVGAAFERGNLRGQVTDVHRLGTDRTQQWRGFLGKLGTFHDRIGHVLHLRREFGHVEQ